MRLIGLGVCIDNIDPKGLGRIRCIDYDDYISGKENYKNYEPYSKDDPFVAGPFLPTNINFVPEFRQAVRIIRYDNEKTTTNQEYIAGPFTTSYDFNGQSFSQQVSNTSYGIAVKERKDIIKNKDGELPENSKNMLGKHRDYSIDGKYGSDVVFTENGVVLRGGKLLSKQAATPNERKTLVDFPLAAEKSARLHLKKFSEKKVSQEEVIEKSITESKDLKYIIEYSVDDLDTPSMVDFYIYEVRTKYGFKYNTSNFNEFTVCVGSEVNLLSTGGTNPSFSIDLNTLDGYTALSSSEKLSETYNAIRNTISDIQKNGFKEILPFQIISTFYGPDRSLEDVYPFFFRPTVELKDRSVTTNQNTNRKTIINGVKLTSKTSTGSGLVYSIDRLTAPVKKIKENKKSLKKDSTTREQTFGGLTADKIYLISTDTNFTDKKIDFKKLDTYEYSQEDYLERIEPNTYSLVRGEVLLEVLRSMYNVLTSHVHNINKPYVKADYSPHENMEKLFNKLENELLNKSVKTN